MRFLCLHGMGTNSRIFEMQTGVAQISSANEEYLQYGDHNSPESYSKALQDLENYLEEEGPFDGVMAFSQGAGLAATLLAQKQREDEHRARLNPIFKFAVFFCGGVPEDPSGVRGAGGVERRLMSFEQDGEVIRIPTAHVWGAYDKVYPTFGPVLSKLCDSSQSFNFVHQGGHEIPGPKDQDGVLGAIRVIKRVIQLAHEAH